MSDALVETEADKPSKTAGETSKHLTVRIASARLIYENWFKGSPGSGPDYLVAARWSRRLLDAELGASDDHVKAITTVSKYLERAKLLQSAGEKLFGAVGASREANILAYYVTDAEVLVLQTSGGDVAKRKEWEPKRVSLAKAIYEKSWEFFQAGGHASQEELFEWSSRWCTCQERAATTSERRQTAYEAHLSRMKNLRVQVANWFAAGRVPAREDFASQYYVADAEIQLLQQRSP